MSYALNPFTGKLDNIGTLTNPVGVAQGGTGLSSYTIGDMLVATGTTTLSVLSAPATGQLLISQGVGVSPGWSTTASLVGTYGLGTSVDAFTVTVNSTGNASSRRAIVINVAGGTTNNDAILVNTGTINIQPLTASLPLKLDSTKRITAALINLASTSDVTGIVPVANGGTGLGSYAQGDILVATGTGTIGSVSDVATGSVLVSGGTNTVPAYSASPTITTSVTVPTVFGSASSSGNLLLQSTSNATRGFVQVEDLMQVGTSAHAFAATASYYIDVGTGGCSVTTGAMTGLRWANTLTVKGNSASTVMALFNAQGTITDDGTARTVGAALLFPSNMTYTATVVSGLTVNDLAALVPANTGFYYALTLNRTGAGTGTMTSAAALYVSAVSSIGTGWTLTNYIGVLIDKPAVTGTLTNFYGIKNNGAAATNFWFLYETGGMQSSHKGNLRLGDNTAPTALLDVQGTINTNQNIANGSVATVLGSVGPVGSHTTVQEWLKVNINGTTRFIPCF